MRIGLSICLFCTLLVNCRTTGQPSRNVVKPGSGHDTTGEAYNALLTQREGAFATQHADQYGTMVATIAFEVKTGDTANFSDGLIHSISIAKPEADIATLIDKNKIVVTKNEVRIVIDYPLNHPYRLPLKSPGGFTRAKLLKEISRGYHRLYAEEEASATIKTIPQDQRKGTYNRNETNGKYGIWGHDIGDLQLTGIEVYEDKAGVITLVLDIDS